MTDKVHSMVKPGRHPNCICRSDDAEHRPLCAFGDLGAVKDLPALDEYSTDFHESFVEVREWDIVEHVWIETLVKQVYVGLIRKVGKKFGCELELSALKMGSDDPVYIATEDVAKLLPKKMRVTPIA